MPEGPLAQLPVLPGEDESREPEGRERTAKLFHQADREVRQLEGPPLDRLGRNSRRRLGAQRHGDVLARHGRRNRRREGRPRRGDGPGHALYFDHAQTLDKKSDPGANDAEPIPLEKVYSFEPIPKEFTPDQAKHILGAQAQMWSDTHPTERDMEAMVYPRACALAEVDWSPSRVSDYPAFFQRLLVHEKRLKELGVNSRPLDTIPQPKEAR